MFTLTAPYPMCQVTTMLPNPQFSDQEALTDSVSRKLAMDGTRYTYVKRRGGRRKLLWTFALSRPKSLELRAFFMSYYASRVLVTDHNGRKWLGHFTSNPFEFEGRSRAAPAIAPMPRGETWTVEVEFEGVEDA